jgi:hypothetical protein
LAGLVWSGLVSGAGTPVEGQQPPPRAALYGTVVDADGGRAVGGAEVVLEGTRLRTVTDDKGRFGFETLRPGDYFLQVYRIGYETRGDSLSVPDGISMEITIEVSVAPIELAGIEVVTRSLLLETRGFYDRKRQGFRGFFMDRPAIEKQDPLFVTQLFRSIPGVEVVNGSYLRMSQSVTLFEGGMGCEPSLWLDGIRSNIRNYDYIRPDHVEGLEVYTGGGAPGKYNDLCGTVVIWTRVPMRRR